MTKPTPQIIGRVEKLDFPQIEAKDVHARIDTGARTSAIWVSHAVEQPDGLAVIFFDKKSPHYTGKTHYFKEFSLIMVASSNGQAEARYRVRLSVVLHGRKINAHFTLADRSTQVYPVLVGRNVLRGKFIVDVKQGQPQLDAEKRRAQELRSLVPAPTKEPKKS